MKKTIAYFMELENGEFDLDEAVEFLRDMVVETAQYEDLIKFRKKLEKKIKDYMKATGQAPEVSRVQTQFITKRPTERVEIVLLKGLAADVRREGHEDIADRILNCIVEIQYRPSVKFVYEDLKF